MFRRSITMPSHVQADKIEALAQDGVLQILVPKAKEMHATRIQVRHGKAKPAVTGKAIRERRLRPGPGGSRCLARAARRRPLPQPHGCGRTRSHARPARAS